MKRSLFIGLFVLISLGLFYNAPFGNEDSISGNSILSPSIPSHIFGCLQYGYFKQRPHENQPARSTTRSNQYKPQCNDGIDNDGDALVDYGGIAIDENNRKSFVGRDPGCSSPNDTTEQDDPEPITQPDRTQPAQSTINAANFKSKCFDPSLSGFVVPPNRIPLSFSYEDKPLNLFANENHVSAKDFAGNGELFDRELEVKNKKSQLNCGTYTINFKRSGGKLVHEFSLKEKTTQNGITYCNYDSGDLLEKLDSLGGTPLNREQLELNCPLMLGDVELSEGEECSAVISCNLTILPGEEVTYVLSYQKDACGNSIVERINDGLPVSADEVETKARVFVKGCEEKTRTEHQIITEGGILSAQQVAECIPWPNCDEIENPDECNSAGSWITSNFGVRYHLTNACKWVDGIFPGCGIGGHCVINDDANCYNNPGQPTPPSSGGVGSSGGENPPIENVIEPSPPITGYQTSQPTTQSCPRPCSQPTTQPSAPECSDGEDNDNDRLIDWREDDGCEGPADNSENSLPLCSAQQLTCYPQNIGDNNQENIKKWCCDRTNRENDTKQVCGWNYNECIDNWDERVAKITYLGRAFDCDDYAMLSLVGEREGSRLVTFGGVTPMGKLLVHAIVLRRGEQIPILGRTRFTLFDPHTNEGEAIPIYSWYNNLGVVVELPDEAITEIQKYYGLMKNSYGSYNEFCYRLLDTTLECNLNPIDDTHLLFLGWTLNLQKVFREVNLAPGENFFTQCTSVLSEVNGLCESLNENGIFCPVPGNVLCSEMIGRECIGGGTLCRENDGEWSVLECFNDQWRIPPP